MPTHRESLRRLSVSEFVECTGMAAATVVKRLRAAGLEPVARDGRTTRDDSRLALPALYAAASPQAERARLDKARAEAQELQNAVAREEYVPATDVDAMLIGLSTLVSQRMQGLPSALAAELAAETAVRGCERLLDAAIRDALHALTAEAERAFERAEPFEEADAPS